MGMAIDSKRIVDKISKSEIKKNYSIALTPSLMEDFKGECDRLKVKYSPVIEELIKEFLESSKKKK
jgi:hypothetical protein